MKKTITFGKQAFVTSMGIKFNRLKSHFVYGTDEYINGKGQLSLYSDIVSRIMKYRKRAQADNSNIDNYLIYNSNVRINKLLFRFSTQITKFSVYRFTEILQASSTVIRFYLNTPERYHKLLGRLSLVKGLYTYITYQIVTCADLRYAYSRVKKSNLSAHSKSVLLYRYPDNALHFVEPNIANDCSIFRYLGDLVHEKHDSINFYLLSSYSRPSRANETNTLAGLRQISVSTVGVKNTKSLIHDLSPKRNICHRIHYRLCLLRETIYFILLIVYSFLFNHPALILIIKSNRRATACANMLCKKRIDIWQPFTTQFFSPSIQKRCNPITKSGKLKLHCYSFNPNIPPLPSLRLNIDSNYHDLFKYLSPVCWSVLIPTFYHSESSFYKVNLIKCLDDPEFKWQFHMIPRDVQVKQFERYGNSPNTLLGFESISEDLSTAILPEEFDNMVLVYDIPPVELASNQYRYSLMGDPTASFEFTSRFLSDIVAICNELNIAVIHKPKYSLSNYNEEYLKLLSSLSSSYKSYHYLDPYSRLSNSGNRLLGIISAPFTSMNHFSQVDLNINIYYSPIDPNSQSSIHPFASPFELITGANSLRKRLLGAKN